MANKNISTVDYTDTFNTFFVKDEDDIKQISKDNVKSVLEIVAPIKCETEESEMLNIQDIAEYPLQELHIYGKSTQDGTPTPDNPVEIVSVENPTVVSSVGGRNYILNTSNQLKTVTCNGWYIPIGNTGFLNQFCGKVITARVWIENCDTDAKIQIWTNNGSKNGNYVKKGEKGYSTFTFTVPDSFTDCNLAIGNGSTKTVTFKELKLEIGNVATDWTPAPEDDLVGYDDLINKVTYQVLLNGIGDVKDELIVYANGTGQLIQRIDSKINTQTSTSDHSECILATPIITEISVQEMNSYYPVTNIFTDTNATLKAKYVADTKNYIDRKFDELATALVAQTSEQ